MSACCLYRRSYSSPSITLALAWILSVIAKRLLRRLRLYAIHAMDRRGDTSDVDLEKRAATLAELRGEMDLMEAERDGALAQIARLSRELREARAAAAESRTIFAHATGRGE